MNDNTFSMIKKSMYSIVNRNIEQKEIRDMLLQFVDYQSEKGLPFGELLILHYNFFHGNETEEIYSVAAAVEFLVLSFDILDDFEDEDSKDKPWSTNQKLALNATTNLLFLNFNVIRNTNLKNKEKGISILIEYALKSINGQYKDLLNICRTESEYIKMSIEKSGSIVALACLLGAVLATDEYPASIITYSEYIGLIGQINNDLADIQEWNDKNDLINHKYSLPIIFLLNCQDEEVQMIRDYYNNKVSKIEILKNQELVNKMFIDTGAIIYTEVIKKLYQNKAMAEIKSSSIEQCSIEQLLKYIY